MRNTHRPQGAGCVSPGPCPQARLPGRCCATNRNTRDPTKPSPPERADSTLPENTQERPEGALSNHPGTRGPVAGNATPTHSEVPCGTPLPPRGRCPCRAGSVTATPAVGTRPAWPQLVGGLPPHTLRFLSRSRRPRRSPKTCQQLLPPCGCAP